MTRSLVRSCSLLTLLIAIATVIGCRGAKPAPPKMPPAQVTVAKVIAYPVQHYLDYNGFLDAVETVQIKARVKGFLNAVTFKDKKREGEEVEKGDLLYQIDPREYEAAVAKSTADIARYKADIKNAEAQIKLAEAELERNTKAVNMGAGSKSDLDKAQAQLEANRAQLDTAKANVEAGKASLQMDQLNLDYTTIYAPISGRISRTQVTQGNLVGQNELTLLTTIVQMDPLYVYFDIPERDLVEYQRSLQGKPSTNSTANTIEVAVATEVGFPHIGKIDFRENRVETGTGTIRIRGRIGNPFIRDKERLLYPGLYARVRIPVGPDEPQPVIPEDALMTGQEGRFVYVIGEGNIVEKRSVTVGPQVWAPPPPGATRQAGWKLANPKAEAGKPEVSLPLQSIVAIEKGLKTGERIIVNGLQKARPGSEVAPDEWQIQAPTSKVEEKK